MGPVLWCEARHVAAAATRLAKLHDHTGIIRFTEDGVIWAAVMIAPHGPTLRSVFPVFVDTGATDTPTREHAGVIVSTFGGDPHVTGDMNAYRVVLERATRMHRILVARTRSESDARRGYAEIAPLFEIS